MTTAWPLPQFFADMKDWCPDLIHTVNFKVASTRVLSTTFKYFIVLFNQDLHWSFYNLVDCYRSSKFPNEGQKHIENQPHPPVVRILLINQVCLPCPSSTVLNTWAWDWIWIAVVCPAFRAFCLPQPWIEPLAVIRQTDRQRGAVPSLAIFARSFNHRATMAILMNEPTFLAKQIAKQMSS